MSIDPKIRDIGIPIFFLVRNYGDSYEAAREFFFFLRGMELDLTYYGQVQNVINQRGNEILKQETEKILWNRAVVVKALKNNGLGLQYLPTSMRGEYWIVVNALRQNGLALQYASNELRDDRRTVSSAVILPA